MKRFALAAIAITIMSLSCNLSAQTQERWITLSSLTCGGYPTSLSVRFYNSESDTVPKWQGALTLDGPTGSKIQFPLSDPALIAAFSTESLSSYRLQCEGEAEFPISFRLDSVAYSSHSYDSSSLGGKPASAYALADSVGTVDTSALNANLNSESSRAQTAEANLAQDIAAEAAARQNADIASTANINNELQRAQVAEAVLTLNLNAMAALVAKLEARIAALEPAPQTVSVSPTAATLSVSTSIVPPPAAIAPGVVLSEIPDTTFGRARAARLQ